MLHLFVRVSLMSNSQSWRSNVISRSFVRVCWNNRFDRDGEILYLFNSHTASNAGNHTNLHKNIFRSSLNTWKYFKECTVEVGNNKLTVKVFVKLIKKITEICWKLYFQTLKCCKYNALYIYCSFRDYNGVLCFLQFITQFGLKMSQIYLHKTCRVWMTFEQLALMSPVCDFCCVFCSCCYIRGLPDSSSRVKRALVSRTGVLWSLRRDAFRPGASRTQMRWWGLYLLQFVFFILHLFSFSHS